jgi:hypothetical protein
VLTRELRLVLRRLLVWANVLAGLGAAILVVLLWVAPEWFGAWDERLQVLAVALRERSAALFLFWPAVLLLVANLVYVLYGRQPRQPLRFVVSEEPGGTVRVTREALESGLRTAGEALAGISRLRVHVEHAGLKRVRVRAVFQTPDGVPLHETGHGLRVALATRFSEMVRLSEGWKVEFELEFHGYQGKVSKRAEEAPAPFTGPQYPIDDEDPFEGRRVS